MQHHGGGEGEGKETESKQRERESRQCACMWSTYLCELREARFELLIGRLAQRQLHHFVLAQEEPEAQTERGSQSKRG